MYIDIYVYIQHIKYILYVYIYIRLSSIKGKPSPYIIPLIVANISEFGLPTRGQLPGPRGGPRRAGRVAPWEALPHGALRGGPSRGAACPYVMFVEYRYPLVN